jgi:hypothetical protein
MQQSSAQAESAPCMFDSEARFAHASQPMDRLPKAASPARMMCRCYVSPGEGEQNSRDATHHVHGTNATIVERPAPFGHLKMDVGGAHHRCLCDSPPTLGIQTTFDSTLAVTQDFRVGSVHSKCFFSLVGLD